MVFFWCIGVIIKGDLGGGDSLLDVLLLRFFGVGIFEGVLMGLV